MSGALICRGEVFHARLEPVSHSFTYRAAFGLFDIDDLPRLAEEVPLFGYNRRRPVSLFDADYLEPRPGSVRQKLDALLSSRGAPGAAHRGLLLTCPRFLGYTFNPVSVLWCLGTDGAVHGAVLQVANTYGECHLYVLTTPEPATAGYAAAFRMAKEFFVSPFNDLKGEYRVKLSLPGPQVSVAIELWREDRLHIASRLSGTGVPLTTRSLLAHLAGGALSALLTRPRIARQSLALKHGHGLKDLMKPRPSSALTFRSADRRTPTPAPSAERIR